jgi:hypothetical protein
MRRQREKLATRALEPRAYVRKVVSQLTRNTAFTYEPASTERQPITQNFT